jgi:hypothetical protein
MRSAFPTADGDSRPSGPVRARWRVRSSRSVRTPCGARRPDRPGPGRASLGRSLPGPPRRRRQLRRGHLVRVSPASRRTDRPGRRAPPPAERAREVLGFYRDYIASAPDELTTIVVLRMAPPRAVPPSVGARTTGGDVRPHGAPRAQLLLEVGVSAAAQRCPDRQARRARLARPDAGVLHDHVSPGRCGRQRGPGGIGLRGPAGGSRGGHRRGLVRARPGARVHPVDPGLLGGRPSVFHRPHLRELSGRGGAGPPPGCLRRGEGRRPWARLGRRRTRKRGGGCSRPWGRGTAS